MSKETTQLIRLFKEINHQPVMAAQVHRHGRGPQRLLRLLSRHEGLSNAEIAETLDIRPSSVSANIKQLEQQQLIKRQPSLSDKRVSTVSLTAKGRQMTDELNHVNDQLSERIFANLTAKDRGQLIKLLTKVNQQAIELSTSYDVEFADLTKQSRMIKEQFHQTGTEI